MPDSLAGCLLSGTAFLSGHSFRAVGVSYRVLAQNGLKPGAGSYISAVRTAEMMAVAGKVIPKNGCSGILDGSS